MYAYVCLCMLMYDYVCLCAVWVGGPLFFRYNLDVPAIVEFS